MPSPSLDLDLDFTRHFRNDEDASHSLTHSLTAGDLLGVALLCAAFFITLVSYSRTHLLDRKKLAFCLTAVNAALMSVVSVVYMCVKYSMGHNVFDLFGGRLEWWVGRDNVSVAVLVWFGTANIMDIVLGLAFYREHLYMVTTWVHHSVYIWLMVLLVTGDGYVATLPSPYTPAFMCALLEELPTLILAIGTIFPQYRQDFAFGITFFITRIVFHSYLLFYMFRLDPPVIIIICYVNPLLLHLHWFSGWLSKYAFEKSPSPKKIKEL